jgi:hypothetical protein
MILCRRDAHLARRHVGAATGASGGVQGQGRWDPHSKLAHFVRASMG